MNSRTNPPDGRLTAVRAFVVLAAVLVAVTAVVLIWVLRRPAPAVPAPSQAAAAAAAETGPRLNEYLYEDRYVVAVAVPGADPEVRVGYDPLTRQSVLTLVWSPPEPPADAGRLQAREEFRPAGFRRTVSLPEGLSTPEAVLRNGILTLSFPRRGGAVQPVVVRKEP